MLFVTLINSAHSATVMSRPKPLLARCFNIPLHSKLGIVALGNFATSHGEEKLVNSTGLFLSTSVDVACTSRHPWSHSTVVSVELPQRYIG